MKRKIFTLLSLLAVVASISGVAIAINANKLDQLSDNNDLMYAQTSTSLVSNKSIDQAPEDSTLPDRENITINEAQTSIRTKNSNKVKDMDLVLNKSKKNTMNKTPSNIKNVASQETTSYSAEKPDKDIYNKQDSLNKEATSLTKEDALNLLKEKNKHQHYTYMGDENTYSILKEKGHEGYVFLPDSQTDLGMFVNKNTKEVYYFHPSGYMDIY
nr:hypothetical protein [uncultured Peptostreptococcus sp.]